MLGQEICFPLLKLHRALECLFSACNDGRVAGVCTVLNQQTILSHGPHHQEHLPPLVGGAGSLKKYIRQRMSVQYLFLTAKLALCAQPRSPIKLGESLQQIILLQGFMRESCVLEGVHCPLRMLTTHWKALTERQASWNLQMAVATNQILFYCIPQYLAALTIKKEDWHTMTQAVVIDFSKPEISINLWQAWTFGPSYVLTCTGIWQNASYSNGVGLNPYRQSCTCPRQADFRDSCT